ncbi:hypothetical protein, partial [Desulfurispira natronophila]|uniref:hypothetical protein n=1 Tax=Desulfurispira natronophila TaxID=682562 RepID=UPI001C849C5B
LRFVHSQDVATWIDCHKRAFEFFGGVPRTVMADLDIVDYQNQEDTNKEIIRRFNSIFRGE